MAKSSKVTVDFILEDADGNEEQDWVAEVKITQGTRDYFDKDFGNWLPGDPEDAEILKVWRKGSPSITMRVEALSQDTANSIIEDAFSRLEDW